MSRVVGYVVVLLFSLSLFAAAVMKPAYNWDVIGYVASAYKNDDISKENLRQKTYNDIKSVVTDDKFNLLISASTYRETVYKDSESLWQQIPFYSIRIVYVSSIKFIGDIVGSYAQASSLISAFCASLSILCLAIVADKLGFSPMISLVSIPFGITNIATLSTADSIASLAIFIVVACYVFSNYKLLILTIPLIPLFRTDYVIFSIFFSFFLFRGKLVAFMMVSLMSITLYFVIGKVCGNMGYLTIFNFTMIDRNPYPLDMNIATDIFPYIKSYLSGGVKLINSLSGFVIFVVICRFSLVKLNLDCKKDVLILSSFLTVLTHFTLFPATLERNYFPFIVLIVFLLLGKDTLGSWSVLWGNVQVVLRSTFKPFGRKFDL